MSDETVKINIAILTSGEDHNTENLIQYFEPFLDADISCIISNNDISNNYRRYKIPKYITEWYIEIDQILTKHNIHYVVLCGYSDKIPVNFCNKYKWKMVNIQSCLPKHIGVSLNSDDIHKSVIRSGDEESGITIHFVESEYNNSSIIFQKTIKVGNDTWEELKSRINDLEHKFYPTVVEKLIKGTYSYLYNENGTN